MTNANTAKSGGGEQRMEGAGASGNGRRQWRRIVLGQWFDAGARKGGGGFGGGEARKESNVCEKTLA